MPDHSFSFQAAEVGGVLDTARNQGIVAYKGDALNPRKHFMTIVSLLQENVRDSDENTCKAGHFGGTAGGWPVAIVGAPNSCAPTLFPQTLLARSSGSLSDGDDLDNRLVPKSATGFRWRPSTLPNPCRTIVVFIRSAVWYAMIFLWRDSNTVGLFKIRRRETLMCH